MLKVTRISLHRPAAIAVASAVAAAWLLFPSNAGAATGCTATTLIPVLRSTTVTQGMPDYSPLVAGKDALVRFYLSAPQCASGTTQTISITGARLRVTNPNAPQSAFDPLVALTGQKLGAYEAGAQTNSAADPLFHVSGPALAGSVGPYTVSFDVDVTYTSSLSSAARTSTFSASGSFAGQSSAVKVLAIPMGDPTGAVNPTTPQFGSSAASTAQQGFATVARLFPTAQGAADMTSPSTAGVRYVLDRAALADVSAEMTSGGRFCGTSDNFPSIGATLDTFLLQYNLKNQAATADHVMGLVDPAVSATCALGMSLLGGDSTWVEARNGITAQTGSVMSMELAHNSGDVPPTRDNPNSPSHSTSKIADTSISNRTFNLQTGNLIGNGAFSTMYYQGNGYNDSTTLFEPADWQLLLCRLGGPATTDCNATAVGTSAAGATQVVVGATDDTPAGTVIDDAFVGSVLTDPSPSSSDYHFVQRAKGGRVLADQLVAVRSVISHHDADEGEGGSGNVSAGGTFSIRYPALADAARWELWKGVPGQGTLLAQRSLFAAPQVGSLKASPADAGPGHALAGPNDFGTGATRIGFDDVTPGTEVSDQYSAQGVTFSGGSSVPEVVADPTTSSLPSALSNDAAVLGGVPVPHVGDASPLTLQLTKPVSKIGMHLGGLPGQNVTATLSVFRDGESKPFFTTTATPGPTGTFIGAASPIADIDHATLTFAANGPVPGNAEEIDDLQFETGKAPSGLQKVSATTSYDPDQDPTELRGTFFEQCPQSTLPLAVAIKASSVDQSHHTATFDTTVDPRQACGSTDAVVVGFQVSNGFRQSNYATTDVASQPDAPIVSIASSTISGAHVEHRALSLVGTGYSNTDGVLSGDHLKWFLSGPNYAERQVGSGSQVDVVPPGGDFTPGDYTVRLVATDSTGASSETSAPIQIVTDADGDGIPASDESCYNSSTDPNPDQNSLDAYSDPDGDGLPNDFDDAPCVAATFSNARENFDPDTLYIPSSGNDVTVSITVPGRNLGRFPDFASTVHISEIQGQPVDIPVTAWNVNPDGSAVAKFSRSVVVGYFQDSQHQSLLNHQVRFVVSGSTQSGGWSFEGSDLSLVKPAN